MFGGVIRSLVLFGACCGSSLCISGCLFFCPSFSNCAFRLLFPLFVVCCLVLVVLSVFFPFVVVRCPLGVGCCVWLSVVRCYLLFGVWCCVLWCCLLFGVSCVRVLFVVVCRCCCLSFVCFLLCAFVVV